MREEVYVSINEGGKEITYFSRDDGTPRRVGAGDLKARGYKLKIDGTVPREIKKRLNDLLN